MGTPMHPEGVPHWSNKTMWRHKLELRRKRQQGFWIFFDTCCGQCGDGGYVENILDGVTAVRMEAEYGGFSADILLERGDRLPMWLEFIHTSPPSESKLTYCATQGIDLIELDGSREPMNASVIRAHIAPQNCRSRNRARLYELWEHMASVEDPVVGIREDFRKPERQQSETEAFIAEVTGRSQAVRNGRISCVECGRQFVSEVDSISLSSLEVHHPESECGWVPVCRECLYEFLTQDTQPSSGIRDLDPECPDCEPYLVERSEREKQAKRTDHLRSIEQNEGTYTKLIHEPDWGRVQSYVVGKRTVSKEDVQSILMSFQLILSLPQQSQMVGAIKDQVDWILRSVNYPNNIYAWDWLAGVGESYHADDIYTGDQGDKFIYPRRWWRGRPSEFPPDPLKDISSLIDAMGGSR